MVLRAGEPPCVPSPRPGHKVLSWREGDHNHPLPTQAVRMRRPASAAAGPTGDLGRGGAPGGPSPLTRPWTAALAAPRGNPGGAHAPPTGGTKMPVPAHQGGSRAPVMAHGRALGEVTQATGPRHTGGPGLG